MNYRRMGRTGLKLSEISIGTWQNFENDGDYDNGKEILKAALENGVNYIDGAEGYGSSVGESERLAGRILREIAPPRNSYAVSGKIIPIEFGHKRPILSGGLNRKHIVDGCDEARERFGVSYLDLYFCHRPDPETELEETCFAMTELIRQGKILYWGTSCFTPEQFSEIFTICDRYNLYKPSVEQCEFSLIRQEKVTSILAPVIRSQGIGITAYSPLSGGILTGKYLDGTDDDTRVAKVEWFRNANEEFLGQNQKLVALKAIADEIEIPMARLSLALALKNDLISSLIAGASSRTQIEETCKASEDARKLSADIVQRALALFAA